ncbi:MAG: hypothetical protein C4345_04025 [Chloroflexota bacterium]
MECALPEEREMAQSEPAVNGRDCLSGGNTAASNVSKSYAERGVVIVQIALTLTVLLAFAGLLVDGGMAFGERRRAQRAADAAALAAVQYISQKGDCSPTEEPNIRSIAAAYTQLNGYTLTDPSTQVLISRPTAAICRVQVRIDTSVSTFLIHILNKSRTAVSAAGTADYYLSAAAGAGLMALSETGNCPSVIGLTDTGGARVTVNGTAIINTQCSDPNQASLKVSGTSMLDATGGIWDIGKFDCNVPSNCTTTPQQLTQRVADPFAYLATSIPQWSGYPQNCNGSPVVNGGNVTVGPYQDGPYVICFNKGAPAIKVQNNEEVRLRPGIYVLVQDSNFNQQNQLDALEMTGGNFCVNYHDSGTNTDRCAANAGEAGPGVVLILTSTSRPNGSRNLCGNFKFTGGTMTLSARTVLPFRGISIYLDPNCPPGPSIDITGNGFNNSGAVYWPRGPLKIGGTSNFTTGPLIADTMTFAGNRQIRVNSLDGNQGPPGPYFLVR